MNIRRVPSGHPPKISILSKTRCVFYQARPVPILLFFTRVPIFQELIKFIVYLCLLSIFAYLLFVVTKHKRVLCVRRYLGAVVWHPMYRCVTYVAGACPRCFVPTDNKYSYMFDIAQRKEDKHVCINCIRRLVRYPQLSVTGGGGYFPGVTRI